MTHEQKRKLFDLAAEMVRCEGMPSEFVDDWPKTVGAREKTRIGLKAREKSVSWAVRIRKIVEGE